MQSGLAHVITILLIQTTLKTNRTQHPKPQTLELLILNPNQLFRLGLVIGAV